MEKWLPLFLSPRELFYFVILEAVKITLDEREVGDNSHLCCYWDNFSPFLVCQTFLLRLVIYLMIAPFLLRVLAGREKGVSVVCQQVVSRQ